MSRLDEELLKKSSEHNDGRLTNLEEITLHQRELVKIENLDKLCRHLKIVYLQNNIIEKIENLSKLKELDYLNLALNNISIIENLEGCESLRKLDLTVNFIELQNLEQSCMNLRKNKALEDLYFTGNPCTDWKYYRKYVIAIVDTILMLDGTQVYPSERIQAQQNLAEMQEDLQVAIELAKIEKEKKRIENENRAPDDKREAYSRENRKNMYMDMHKQKLEEDMRKNPKKYEKKELSSTTNKTGEMRQCNEGQYKWLLNEHDEADYSVFTVEISKYIDTSLITTELFPNFVSVRIKGKLLQIRLNDEIFVDQSTIQRSQATGQLMIRMKKVEVNEYYLRIQNERKRKEEIKQEEERIARMKSISDSGDTKKQKSKTLTSEQPKKTYDATTFDDIPDLE